MKRFISIILCTFMLLLAGCSGKPKVRDFQVGNCTMVLKTVSTDLTSEPALKSNSSNIGTPTGQWVAATFAITQGEILYSDLQNKLLKEKIILLNEKEPSKMYCNGARIIIQNNAFVIYLKGTVTMLFDMDKTYDVKKAVVTVNGEAVRADPSVESIYDQELKTRSSSSSQSSSSTEAESQ